MANKWFKFYGGEYLADPKIAALTPQEKCCWVTLLCLASIASTAGIIEFLTIEVLLEKSGISFDPYHPEEWNKCLGILKKLEKMKMVKVNDSGVVEIIHWDVRQDQPMTPYERVKKFREKKATTQDLPDWVDKEVWAEWVAYRKDKKQTLTEQTIKLQLKKLEKDKENHRAILIQSMENGWTGIFEIKDKGRETKKGGIKI